MRTALSAISTRAIRVTCVERLGDVVTRVRDNGATHCVVVDDDGTLVGVVGLQDAALAPSLRIFSDLVPSTLPPRVLPTTPLHEIGQLMDDETGGAVLVYDEAQTYRGLITKDSLLTQLLEEQATLLAKVEAFGREKEESASALEATVAERTAELRAAIEEMEVFSYSLSHDLRAPLLRMITYADIVSADYGDLLPADGKHRLERISASGGHLVKLIRDIQAFVHVSKQPQTLQRILTSTLVGEVVESYRTFLDEREAELLVESEFPDVHGQYASLFQVLGNLLYNAAKFVPANARPRISVRAESAEGRVRLRVDDSGIGVPEEMRNRLFKPFSRLHGGDNYEGTGLGLAFARVAMQRMGGKVGYEPRSEGGSSFWLELPAANDASTPALTAPKRGV